MRDWRNLCWTFCWQSLWSDVRKCLVYCKMRVVKGIFVTRDRPFFFPVKCEMGHFFLVNRDFHTSREAWFCKIIIRETRNKCLIRREPWFSWWLLFRELWKDRFIFRETWSRPPLYHPHLDACLWHRYQRFCLAYFSGEGWATVLVFLLSIVRTTLHDVYMFSSSSQAIYKLSQSAREHFLTFLQVEVHVISCIESWPYLSVREQITTPSFWDESL